MSANVRAWTGKEGQWNFQFKHHTSDYLFQCPCYCVEKTDIEKSLMTQSQ